MRWSQWYIPTLKEAPGDAEVISHKLLILSLIHICAKNPGKTLDGILEEVQYDVPEGGSEPRCSDLDGMTETEDLAQLLLWTQGYLESELSENEEADQDQAIHQDMFREDVAEVLAQCKGGGSDAKLIDVMRKVIMGEE